MPIRKVERVCGALSALCTVVALAVTAASLGQPWSVLYITTASGDGGSGGGGDGATATFVAVELYMTSVSEDLGPVVPGRGQVSKTWSEFSDSVCAQVRVPCAVCRLSVCRVNCELCVCACHVPCAMCHGPCVSARAPPAHSLPRRGGAAGWGVHGPTASVSPLCRTAPHCT